MSQGFLEAFPRVALAHLPTPLEPMPRLSNYLKGARLFVKRDDCTGLATGGNKTRKLEFLLGDALAQGCDTLVTVGGLQSNHARQTAAAAARAGLHCELLLQEIAGVPEGNYDYNGNLLLDELLGAVVHRFDDTVFLHEELDAFCERLSLQGRSPYAVPLGGSNALGALGYVVAVQELLQQCLEANITPDHIVLASGSAGTQAGVLAGLAAARAETRVIGINVGASEATQTPKVRRLLHETCALLGIDAPDDAAIICNDGYYAPGYGIPNREMVQAVRLVAELEGLMLDPVYSGKAMAGLIDLIHSGALEPGDTTIFLHTGGSAGLFAYPRSF
jgi:D-cysteine desulfhydrase/L-cysteate sulfo-lyase